MSEVGRFAARWSRRRWAPTWRPDEVRCPVTGDPRPEWPVGAALLLLHCGDERGAAAVVTREVAGGGRALNHATQQVVQDAERAGRDAVPLVGAWPKGRARAVALNERTPLAIEGASIGAAWAVAEVSTWLGLPVPDDVAITATVTDGRLGVVDGLPEKIRCVREQLPGVRRLVVAEALVGEARALVGDGLAVVGFSDLEALVGWLWPDRAAAVAERLRADPGLALRVRHLAVGRLPMPNWRAISDSLTLIDPVPVEAAIARRHAGGDALLAWPGPDWEGWERWPETRIALWLSHVVQSAADADDAPVRAYAERAAEWRAGRCGEGAHLARLDGAIGRAFAAFGEYQEASVRLMASAQSHIDGWSWSDASHPVCEGLRVAALLGDVQAVARFEAWADELMILPDVSDTSRQFLDIARARAGLILGTRVPLPAAPEGAWWESAGAWAKACWWRLRVQQSVDLGDLRRAKEMLCSNPSGDRAVWQQVRFARAAVAGMFSDEDERDGEVARLLRRGLAVRDVLRELRY